MTLQKAAELISLGMTFPTVILAIAVVIVWGPAAIRSLRRKEKQPKDWFILGVFTGFIGGVLDNIYWAIPWTASFIDHPLTSTLINIGVYFNIISRQGFGITAAFCHLMAAPNSKLKSLNYLLAAAHIIGVTYSTLLVLFYVDG